MAPTDRGAELAVLTNWLVDTGPLVAYLDPRDPRHDSVARVMDRFQGRTFTTAAVMTEAMYFASKVRGAPLGLADWISRTGTIIVDVCQPPELRAAARLMERYRDTPMDFADATLVLTAELLEVFDVLTLDRRGFAAFRSGDGRPFRLVLEVE